MTVAPVEPPSDWFYEPEPDGPQPLSFSPDGKVTGHLAAFGSCHTGFLNGALAECVKPPQSRDGYKSFHVGTILTDDGNEVPVGKLTFDTAHAPLSLGMQASVRHYDNTGTVGAYVRAIDGKHGIWLSGAVRSDLSPADVQKLRANPPSGDWRARDGNLELIASLSVPVPGFPVFRPQIALAASGGNEVEALILPGYSESDEANDAVATPADYREIRADLVASLIPPRDDKAYIRRRAVLADRSR